MVVFKKVGGFNIMKIILMIMIIFFFHAMLDSKLAFCPFAFSDFSLRNHFVFLKSLTYELFSMNLVILAPLTFHLFMQSLSI